MQSSPSSNNDTPVATTNSNIYPLKTDEEINATQKQQTGSSAQQLLTKNGC